MAHPRHRILDELLVLSAREGSREAYERLVRRWQESLWRHARRLVGREDVAWDVLQEAWIDITKGLSQLEDPARFRRWAYTIVTRRATDWRRRNGRHEAAVEWPAEGLPAADAGEQRAAAVDALRRALRRMDPDGRALLALFYVEGFDTNEIAHILEVPAGTVRSRLHTARSRLREIMERTER